MLGIIKLPCTRAHFSFYARVELCFTLFRRFKVQVRVRTPQCFVHTCTLLPADVCSYSKLRHFFCQPGSITLPLEISRDAFILSPTVIIISTSVVYLVLLSSFTLLFRLNRYYCVENLAVYFSLYAFYHIPSLVYINYSAAVLIGHQNISLSDISRSTSLTSIQNFDRLFRFSRNTLNIP